MARQIHQLVSTITPGDAVGNTTLKTRDALREMGFESEIFRWECAPSLEKDTLPAKDYLKYSSPESTVIFHYSIGSELNRMVWGLEDRLVLCYHNITPPEFFLDIHNHVLGQLYHGRKQLAQFAERCVLAVGDSRYNRNELDEMGFSNTAVLPLALDFSDFDQPADPFILDAFSDHKKNFLFVGRTVPNKKLEDLVKLYAVYKKYVSYDCRLIVVGDSRGFEVYKSQLMHMIGEIDLPDVIFTGKVDFPQLLAFYQIADAYVSLSQHEGFCVPLLEAMHFDVPVLALDRAAVAETMDGAGMLVDEINLAEMAELLNMVTEEGYLRERVIAGQRKRLERYFQIPFADKLKDVLLKAGVEI
jgi:glycosyltransferase involved in cell wall biosynthesis